ncbi:hypothetical protein PAMP_020169 [Pampus punctatissimus]
MKPQLQTGVSVNGDQQTYLTLFSLPLLSPPSPPSPPSPCSSSVCLHSLDPERKFLSVFVNDKLINNSSTQASPSGPRFQGDRRWGSSDWSVDIMYPMKRLLFVAIQQPGAAESASSLQRVDSYRRQKDISRMFTSTDSCNTTLPLFFFSFYSGSPRRGKQR